jgi:hypothetical protein
MLFNAGGSEIFIFGVSVLELMHFMDFTKLSYLQLRALKYHSCQAFSIEKNAMIVSILLHAIVCVILEAFMFLFSILRSSFFCLYLCFLQTFGTWY